MRPPQHSNRDALDSALLLDRDFEVATVPRAHKKGCALWLEKPIG